MADLPKDVERKLAKLEALEAGGVDNWEWYSEALKEWNAENYLEEYADGVLQNVIDTLAGAAYEPSERGAGVAFSSESIDEAREFIVNGIKNYKKGE
jgi:hypothetical protein